MRHKYETRGLVLARTHVGEATTLVTVLTNDLGLVHARAQSLRKPGAKLAHALTTFAESELVLVRGKEGWRIAGAVLAENWFVKLADANARRGAARVSGLLLRLVAGETRDTQLYPIMLSFFEALATLPPDMQEAAEVLAVLRMLAALGLDSGDIPSALDKSDLSNALFAPSLLDAIIAERPAYISRINTGIAASGL